MGGDKKYVSSEQPHSIADSNSSLAPITPIIDTENGDFCIGLKKSPLTLMKKTPFKLYRLDSICKENDSKVDDIAATAIADSVADNGNPITPEADEYDSISDQEMFECLYEDLLEVIVSTQGESLLAELADVAYDSDDCKTPSSAVLLNGIAKTCPTVPMKPACKRRVIPVELRRSFEF